jgi:hypothetical protein
MGLDSQIENVAGNPNSRPTVGGAAVRGEMPELLPFLDRRKNKSLRGEGQTELPGKVRSEVAGKSEDHIGAPISTPAEEPAEETAPSSEARVDDADVPSSANEPPTGTNSAEVSAGAEAAALDAEPTSTSGPTAKNSGEANADRVSEPADSGEGTCQPHDDTATLAAIEPAEDVRDPLDGLVERTATDAGAAFMPEVLERLAELKKGNRAAFQTLRARLKKVGCPVTALDQAIAEETGEIGRRGVTQADILSKIAQSVGLFHTPDGTGFADLVINGHRETWPIRSKGFRHWLARRFFQVTKGIPNSEALQSALNMIEAKAHFDGYGRKVHIRIAGEDGKVYLDLGDESWQAVEIDATGWRVINNPPVRFRRAAGMQALPMPEPGGSIEALRSFLNVKSETDFVLAVAWVLTSLLDRGPYPVIVVSREQGSAKSTFSAILRSLIDPNAAPLRALPREDRDLFIAANNSHVLAFDNVSGLPPWISDTLCRLATGGGFSVRQLYTDQDEVLFDAARPVILNGIEDIVTRPDLADRAVFLTLEPIPEERRRPEVEFWTAFEAERPRILGVLLDAIVEGLKRLPETRLPKLPRMADFALWATACETALWLAGTFWQAYCDNRDEAVEGVIDADPIAATVRALMAKRTVWTGTASDLLGALTKIANERIAKSKTWPDSPRALSGRLRRAASFLRKTGIEIGFEREGRARTRTIRIATTPECPVPENAGAGPSVSSAPTKKRKSANATAASPPRTATTDADGPGDASKARSPTFDPDTLLNTVHQDAHQPLSPDAKWE